MQSNQKPTYPQEDPKAVLAGLVPEYLLRIEQVELITALKRWQIYQLVKAGKFPRQVRIGERAVAWKATEVRAWINSRERV